MAEIVKDRKVASDPWRLLRAGDDGSLAEVPGAGDIIVPLAVWRAHRPHLLLRPGRIGIWLDSHEAFEVIAEDLRFLGVVAVHFPKLADGRGYTIARLLRERYGYRGELRAIGDVQRDQLAFLERCGFNAFALREGENPRQALAAFDEISEAYQGSSAQPLPLFRRRFTVTRDGMEWS